MPRRWLAVLSLSAACGGGASPAPADGGVPDAGAGDAVAVVLPPGDAAEASPPLDSAAEAPRRDAGAIEAGPSDLGVEAPSELGPCHTTPGPLLLSPKPILDAYPLPDGLLVVRADELLLVSRRGELKKSVPSPREITAVGRAGDRLIIADRARLVIYSLALEEQGGVFLKETCLRAVVVDGRFICSAGDDGRSLAVYGLAPPQLLWSPPDRYLFDSEPGVGVPGLPYYVSSRGVLMKVDPSGMIKAVPRSPFGSTYVSQMVAFHNRPATHLINPAGELHRILGKDCDGTTDAPTMGCLARDGVLGTSEGGRNFAALTSDDAGAEIYALLGTGDYDRPCSAGCAVQRIDIGKRAIVSQRRHLIDMTTAIALRHDATCARALLVHRKGDPSRPPFNQPASYAVSLLEY